MSVGQKLEIEILSRQPGPVGSLLEAKITKVPVYNDAYITSLLERTFELTLAFALASLPNSDTLECDGITFETAFGQIAAPIKGRLSKLDVSGADVRVAASNLQNTGTSLTGIITNVPSYKSLLAQRLKGREITVISHRSPNNFRAGSVVTFPYLELTNFPNLPSWCGEEPRPSSHRAPITSAEERIWQAVVDVARAGGTPPKKSKEEERAETILGAPKP